MEGESTAVEQVIPEVRITTSPEALAFYAELLERAIRLAEMLLEDWNKELAFVVEELRRHGVEWKKP